RRATGVKGGTDMVLRRSGAQVSGQAILNTRTPEHLTHYIRRLRFGLICWRLVAPAGARLPSARLSLPTRAAGSAGVVTRGAGRVPVGTERGRGAGDRVGVVRRRTSAPARAPAARRSTALAPAIRSQITTSGLATKIEE